MNASSRMVRAAYSQSEFVVTTHNLKQQMALFAHKDGDKKAEKAIITSIACDVPSTFMVEGGKYTQDLKVSVELSAVNASQLKNTDVVLKYNYQNKNSKDAAIKAEGASIKATSEAQANVGSGNKYVHSFELSNFSNFSASGEKIYIEGNLGLSFAQSLDFFFD